MSLSAILWAMNRAPVDNASELVVLYALADRADDYGRNAWPSQGWIAYRSRMSDRTVRRHLKALEGRGVIARGNPAIVSHLPVDRRPINWDLNMLLVREDEEPEAASFRRRGDSGKNTAGQNDRPAENGAVTAGQIDLPLGDTTGQQCPPVKIRPDTGGKYDRTTVVNTTGHGCPTNPPKNPPLNHPLKDIERSDADVTGDASNVEPSPTDAGPTFEDFWNVVPRKVSRGVARKAWDTAITKADPAVIIEAMISYRNDPNREDAFTKHPSTWLNQECWEDDPLPPRYNQSAPRPAARQATDYRFGTRPSDWLTPPAGPAATYEPTKLQDHDPSLVYDMPANF